MKKIFLSLFFGFLAGICSGFFGAGGGLILIPFISNILKVDETKTRATTIFCVIFLVLVSFIVYFKKININWSVGIKCIIGGIIGGYIGSLLLKKLSNNLIKLLFVIFLLYSGIIMIYF